MTNLKPCPFCGGEAAIRTHPFTGLTNTHGAYCKNCGAQTEQFCDTEAEAAEAWNRRADGWISVKDGLPDVFAVVYVSVATWNGFHNPCTYETLGTVASDGDLCLLYGRLADGERITHWQPLPEPPKEGEHE